MTRRIVGFFIFVVVAVGVAVGVYFAGQVSDGTTAAQEDGENTAATAEALIQQSLAEGTVPPALTITPYPTCPPDPPTPTPIPGEQSTYWLVTPAPWPCIPADQPPPDKTPDLSSLFPEREPPLDASPATLEDELARVEEQLARLEEDCLEKGILPPPITPEIIPATPPWLVTPTTRPSPEEELRDNLNAFPANRKLVISEDIIAVKGFAVLPEQEDDPAKFSQDNIVSGIHHIGSGVSITVDHQGRETPPSIASRSADARKSLDPARRVVVEEGIAELERVLADPTIFAMIVEFLAQPLDPCEVYSGLRNSLPEVCLTTKE